MNTKTSISYLCSCSDASSQMVQHQVTGLFVCNESQQVVGLLTAWDLIQRTYLSNRHPKQVPIHQVLRSKFTSLAKENVSSSCRALVQRMKRTGEHKVAIVDKESVVLWDVLNLQETIMSSQTMDSSQSNKTVKDLLTDRIQTDIPEHRLMGNTMMMDAVEYMFTNGLSSISVYNQTHHFIGQFSSFDILKLFMAPDIDIDMVQLQDIVVRPKVFLYRKSSLLEALQKSKIHSQRHLPVVSEKSHIPLASIDVLEICEYLYFSTSSWLPQTMRCCSETEKDADVILQLFPVTKLILPAAIATKEPGPITRRFLKPSSLIPKFAQDASVRMNELQGSLHEAALCMQAALVGTELLSTDSCVEVNKVSKDSCFELTLQYYKPLVESLSHALDDLEHVRAASSSPYKIRFLAHRAILNSMMDEKDVYEKSILPDWQNQERILQELEQSTPNCHEFYQSEKDEWLVYYVRALVRVGKYEEAADRIKKQSFYFMPARESCLDALSEMAEETAMEGKNSFATAEYANAVHYYNHTIRLQKMLFGLDSTRFPLDCILFSNRSASYFKLDDMHHSLRDAQTCVAMDPSYFKGWTRLFDVLQQKELYESCLSAIQDARVVFKENHHNAVLKAVESRVQTLLVHSISVYSSSSPSSSSDMTTSSDETTHLEMDEIKTKMSSKKGYYSKGLLSKIDALKKSMAIMTGSENEYCTPEMSLAEAFSVTFANLSKTA